MSAFSVNMLFYFALGWNNIQHIFKETWKHVHNLNTIVKLDGPLYLVLVTSICKFVHNLIYCNVPIRSALPNRRPPTCFYVVGLVKPSYVQTHYKYPHNEVPSKMS